MEFFEARSRAQAGAITLRPENVKQNGHLGSHRYKACKQVKCFLASRLFQVTLSGPKSLPGSSWLLLSPQIMQGLRGLAERLAALAGWLVSWLTPAPAPASAPQPQQQRPSSSISPRPQTQPPPAPARKATGQESAPSREPAPELRDP